MPWLFGVVRRRQRLESRLAQGAENLRRSFAASDGGGRRRRSGHSSARRARAARADILSDPHVAAPVDVRLVPFDRTHLVLTREWANDAELARLMDRARPVSEDEHMAWFAALQGREDCRYFAVVEGSVHVGNVWLWAIHNRHRKAEIRIVIGDAGARG